MPRHKLNRSAQRRALAVRVVVAVLVVAAIAV
ncbi:hypothetical protein EV386_1111 [Xylanimonas ulmi]|uniref:Uncharacterized protein n=1 Tax=Xylanimonas ulmi TaxID=228973 RepID=A0A4Q7M0V6_9MICO|nr:hypothetical protein EV386_1111 [Xylanibacterium ulmi]